MPKRHLALAVLLTVPHWACAQAPIVESSRDPSAGQGAAGVVSPGPASAEVFTQLQQMQGEIAQLRGLLEEQQNQIRQLRQEGLERYQDLDQRLSAAPAAQPPAAAPAAVEPAVAAATAPADPAKEKLYYEAAFDLVKARDFDRAAQAFDGFLNKYPNSQYAGNAQYWLGEVYLAKGSLVEARQAFARVGQLYPSHPKVPDALYKLAEVEQRQGNADRARTLLQQVVSQYPGTSAAQLAQRQLGS